MTLPEDEVETLEERLNQMVEDAMCTWRSGRAVPTTGKYYQERDGQHCCCLMTAAVACGDEKLLDELREKTTDDEPNYAVVVVGRRVADRYGLTEREIRSVVTGFDGWFLDDGDVEVVHRQALAVRGAVFHFSGDVHGKRVGRKTRDELQAVQVTRL